MIWLASFPRSGNTFFRIVLHEVYGIESSSFAKEPSPKPGYDRYPVVKTHELPGSIKPKDPGVPAVYLVRDGRDSLVSMAHQRSDLVEPGSDFEENLRDAIIAPRGNHFGGWSRNVNEWLKRADVVIRFEELIADPIGNIEKIRPLLDLPEPEIDRLPSFSDLKKKQFKYGSRRKHLSPEERRDKFFRRGQAGSWKDEMPEDLHKLFWELHGDTMLKLGYNEGALDVPCKNKTFIWLSMKMRGVANRLFR